MDKRKVIRKQGRFVGYACGQRGPCLLGMVGFYALAAGVRPLSFS